jgi:hypothetical protein
MIRETLLILNPDMAEVEFEVLTESEGAFGQVQHPQFTGQIVDYRTPTVSPQHAMMLNHNEHHNKI